MSANSQKLAGKVAIITGASKGIGAAIATHLAAAGASVVVDYSSSKEGADRIVDLIAKRGRHSRRCAGWCRSKPTSIGFSPRPRRLSDASIFSSTTLEFMASRHSRM